MASKAQRKPKGEKPKAEKPKSEDVEMKEPDAPKPQSEIDALTIEDIKDHISIIEKSVVNKEPRFVLRVLRQLASTRKRLNDAVLNQLTKTYISDSYEFKGKLLSYFPCSDSKDEKPHARSVLTEIYVNLLGLISLLDNNRINDSIPCAQALINRVMSVNKPTMHLLGARCFFYYSRAFEMSGRLHEARTLLHGRLRTSTLRHDSEGQAMLLNLLLRNYIHYNLYEQAEKLISKTTFPENANNNESARYLFYLGKIKATQLDYSEAFKNLNQAIRKAPQNAAIGFKQAATKLLVVVQLLLGEVPERHIFRDQHLMMSLHPYLQLTQAVLAGDLAKFSTVLEKYSDKFMKEGTMTLINRLRHNVIKTGIKSVALSYSRISLADVADKLQLDSPEDAEYIIAKAIHDGVIEATIDHEKGYMQSNDSANVYGTNEPLKAYHERIRFCLDIHNHSIKAMRFPPKSYNDNLEDAQKQREREQQDLEYAKEIAEEEDDGML